MEQNGLSLSVATVSNGFRMDKGANSMDVVGIEVHPWSNGVEACGDRSSRGINERLHFVLQVDCGGTRVLLPRVLLLPG